jgi:GT2 family glycosyltransferase
MRAVGAAPDRRGAGDAVEPVVAIVVAPPAHDDALGAWLRSWLAQTEIPLEVLVVHHGDAASKRALQATDDARVTAIGLPGVGTGARANLALSLARAPYVKLLLGDDAAARSMSLVHEVADLAAHPENVARAVVPAGAGLIGELLEARAPSLEEALFRSDALRAIGGFDATLSRALAYDLWLRLVRTHRVLVRSEEPRARSWPVPTADGEGGAAARAERGFVLVRAVCDLGLDGWCRAFGAPSDVAAWTALAVRLRRSGLPEVEPLVRAAARRARELGVDFPSDASLARLAREGGASSPSRGPELAAPVAAAGAPETPSSADREEARNVRGLATLVLRGERALAELRSADRRVEDAATWLRHEISSTRRTAQETLGLATRILDKLRLTRRLSAAARAWRAHVFGGRPRRSATVRSGSEGARAPAVASGPRRRHWLILAAVPLDDVGGGQRSAQLARALARHGDPVSYVARFPRHESVDLGIVERGSGITVLEWDVNELRRRLQALDDRALVLVELPEREVSDFAIAARASGARVIYDKIDNWAACGWAEWYDPATERALMRTADDRIASAALLVRQLGSGSRTALLVPNAVDRTIFRPENASRERPPEDLVRGDVTLLYVGSLWGEWFDWPLVAQVAERRRRWAVNLIGDPPRTRPPLPANVHLLGLKPQSALPPYLAAADACWIPFIPSPLVDGVNPLKVYEYLAMHRPVVAAPMRELADVPYVLTASGADATIAAVERARVAAPPVDELESFVAANTWEARVATLVSLCEQPTITVVVLCYDNRDVIEACVDSLLRNRGDARYEVVVVDNGSRDGSLELLGARAARGDIRLVRNTRNGCSSGRNLGMRSTASEVVVFLDSDQRALFPGWLEPALAILAAHREVGAVGWSGGWFRAGRGRGTVVDDLPDRGAGALGSGGFRTDVAYLATSGLVVPRAVLARTRGFDERLDPTCFEDTDLAFQIKDAGFALAYCPAIGVDHRPHATTGALAAYEEVYRRNERYLLDKWRHRPGYFFDVPE